MPLDGASDSMMTPAKAIHLRWLGQELFCLLLGPRGFTDDLLLLQALLFGRSGTSICHATH